MGNSNKKRKNENSKMVQQKRKDGARGKNGAWAPGPRRESESDTRFFGRGRTIPQTENILEEAHIGEEIWNTENWERMDRRYPHWDLDAWECPSPMDQRMKRNPFEFFAAIWSLAAISSIRPKSMVRTRMRNY